MRKLFFLFFVIIITSFLFFPYKLGAQIFKMSTEVWGLMPKSQDDSTTIDQAIASAIADHEANAESHLGAGESLETHRANEIIDHPASSVVADKFQNFGAILTFTFENISNFSTHGGLTNTYWPGLLFDCAQSADNVVWLQNSPDSSPGFLSYNHDFLFQSSFMLSEEGPSLAWFQFGSVYYVAFTAGVALEIGADGEGRFRWKGNGHDVYTDYFTVSRAVWHVFRIRYSVFDDKLFCDFDGVTLFVLDNPGISTGGYSEFFIKADGGASEEGSLYLEYLTMGRG